MEDEIITCEDIKTEEQAFFILLLENDVVRNFKNKSCVVNPHNQYCVINKMEYFIICWLLNNDWEVKMGKHQNEAFKEIDNKLKETGEAIYIDEAIYNELNNKGAKL